MGGRASKCFGNESAESVPCRFVDPWFRQFDAPTDGYVDSSGVLNRLPLRLESTEVMVYGLVDPQKMWADFEALGEPFGPVLVGGKAVVAIFFNNFTDTDCGGSYLETWYNTFVTPKGEPQLELPFETPFSAIITDTRSMVYLQRVICGDTPNNPGAAMRAVEGGRAIFGFPKHPELASIVFEYKEEGKQVQFEASHGGRSAVSLKVRLPEADEGAVTIPVEVETGPKSTIGGPRNGGAHMGHNGCHQTRYATALKCTQHVKPWDATTDVLTFGDDAHYASLIKQWGFEPVLKVHSPDFKIIAHKPSSWISGETVAEAMKLEKTEKPRFTDSWFRQFDTPTDGFIDCSGMLNRLPLRLESTEVMVYGFVDAAKMWADFDALDEPFVPVLVGGKAVVAIFFNNFIDTDCGGAYLETWYNTFVTPKDEPQLELPFETPFSAIIADPRSLIYLQRVICGDSPTNSGAAMRAIEGGRAIWGFPKHPELAAISFQYKQDGAEIEFEAVHGGKTAVQLKVRLPEADEGAVTIPLELALGPQSHIGGPRNGGTHKGHTGAHQTRYGAAFKCTQHVKPWDPATDALHFGDDAHYAMPIKQWNFEPVLKVHSPDFKIIAHKPSNWLSGPDAVKAMKK
jgi:hypothetical protein